LGLATLRLSSRGLAGRIRDDADDVT
jgi:hypothetical protein